MQTGATGCEAAPPARKKHTRVRVSLRIARSRRHAHEGRRI